MARNLRLTVEPQYHLLEWARTRCGVTSPTWSPESEAMGVMDGDRLLAVIVFSSFDGDSCCAHIASAHTRSWATRNILGGIFGYAFEFKRLNRMNAIIPAARRQAIVMAVKLGFQFEGRMRRAAVDGTDAVMLSMLKDECAWLRPADARPEHGSPDHG